MTLPIIAVQMLAGCTPAQKSTLIERLAPAAIEMLGVPDDAVRIVLNDISPDDWGVGTRTMADRLRDVPGPSPS